MQLSFYFRFAYRCTLPLLWGALVGGLVRLWSGRKHSIRPSLFYASLVLLFVYYPGVTSTIFSAFSCDEFDDASRYLNADRSIDCDTPASAVRGAVPCA